MNQDDEVGMTYTMLVADTADTDVTMDRLARIYLKMRDKIVELERAQEAVKEQQKEVSAAMKDILQAAGGKSMGTTHGTVTLKTTTRYFTQERDGFKQFVVDNNAPDLFEFRIAQRCMAEFLVANPDLIPPGLNTMSELTVSVTKPRK